MWKSHAAAAAITRITALNFKAICVIGYSGNVRIEPASAAVPVSGPCVPMAKLGGRRPGSLRFSGMNPQKINVKKDVRKHATHEMK